MFSQVSFRRTLFGSNQRDFFLATMNLPLSRLLLAPTLCCTPPAPPHQKIIKKSLMGGLVMLVMLPPAVPDSSIRGVTLVHGRTDGRNVKIELEFWTQNSQKLILEKICNDWRIEVFISFASLFQRATELIFSSNSLFLLPPVLLQFRTFTRC